MTRQVSNTIVSTDTFAGWLEKTNEIATELRNSIVTTANTSLYTGAGANTSGNAMVVGYLGANVIALAGNSTSKASIHVIHGSNTTFGNTGGTLVINSNVEFAEAITFTDQTIEGNVTSNGALFDITTSEDTNITSANITIEATTNMTVNSADVVISGNNVDIDSTYANIAGTDLYISSNVFIESANVTVGNGAATTDTSINTATFSVSANTTLAGSNTYVNGTEFKVASNTVIDGALGDINANLDIDNTSTDINATNFIVSGTTANITSTTVNLTGTTANVDTGQLNVSANVNIAAANIYFEGTVEANGGLTVTGGATIGDANGDSHSVTGNTTFNNSVDVSDDLSVTGLTALTGNVAVNSNDLFVDTSNQRVGVGTDAPLTLLHVSGPGAQTSTFEGGSANVLIVANNQSTIFGSQNVVIKAASSKHIKLHSNNQTAADKTVMLSANGNVGIGNTTPAQKLVVAGTANITGTTTLVDVTAEDITANTLTLTTGNATLIDVTAEDITANTLTLTSGNATLIDVTAEDITANTLTLSSNATLVDVTADDITAATITTTSTASLDGGIDVNSSKMTVATSGAITTANTLSVTGSATFGNTIAVTNTATFSNTITVTGDASFGNIETTGQVLIANDVANWANSVALDANTETQEVIVSFPFATYHSAKLVVTGRHTNSTVVEVQSTEALVVTDGTDVFLTRYGTLSTDINNDFSVFTINADINSGYVRVLANTSHDNTSITVLSQLFKIQN
jgi:hypothetical protein